MFRIIIFFDGSIFRWQNTSLWLSLEEIDLGNLGITSIQSFKFFNLSIQSVCIFLKHNFCRSLPDCLSIIKKRQISLWTLTQWQDFWGGSLSKPKHIRFWWANQCLLSIATNMMVNYGQIMNIAAFCNLKLCYNRILRLLICRVWLKPLNPDLGLSLKPNPLVRWRILKPWTTVPRTLVWLAAQWG